MKDNTIIVLDLGNYQKNFQEKVPFKAIILDKTDHELDIESLATGKRYEIYPYQTIEGLDIEEIEKLINLENYGL